MKFYPYCEILVKNAGSNTQKFYRGYEPRPSSKDNMALRIYTYVYVPTDIAGWLVCCSI